MTWRPLSQRDGRSTDMKKESDGSVTFRTQQDVTDILEVNKHLREQDDRGWLMGGDIRRVASIPMTVVHQWLLEGVDVFSGEQQDEVAKRLNDPDNFFLRTAPGRLGPVGDGTYH